MELLRIHVLWAGDEEPTEVGDPARQPTSAEFAYRISRHFDGIGMERDGVAHRVPVRFWYLPWDNKAPTPKKIDFSRAEVNVVIILADGEMSAPPVLDAWNRYLQALRDTFKSRGEVDMYMPFVSSPQRGITLDRQNAKQVAINEWAFKQAESFMSRMLLHVVFKIRKRLNEKLRDRSDEPLFVSHAKQDGDVTAKAIVAYVNDVNNDVPLKTYYDAKELSPGDILIDEFKEKIKKGTLLAIVSDVYDTRPWCVFELTEAKRARRPIVLADVGKVKISRTYPYGANLPRVRVHPASDSTHWIEPLLVECLSEGLRCDLFELEVASHLDPDGEVVLVLPRPPELFDVIDCDMEPSRIIYPDPPLGILEEELITKALRKTGIAARLSTLSEFA